jgi:hypothetical protein
MNCVCYPPCDPIGSENNRHGCSITPVEYVFFFIKKSITVDVKCKRYSKRIDQEPVTEFKFQIGENKDIRHEIVEEIDLGKTINVFGFNNAPYISFLEHIQKNFKNWKNIKKDPYRGKQIQFENNLQRSWCFISDKMAKKYDYEDNTQNKLI